jgi:hypothetical protein
LTKVQQDVYSTFDKLHDSYMQATKILQQVALDVEAMSNLHRCALVRV